jgi:hypothetical protein
MINLKISSFREYSFPESEIRKFDIFRMIDADLFQLSSDSFSPYVFIRVSAKGFKLIAIFRVHFFEPKRCTTRAHFQMSKRPASHSGQWYSSEGMFA